MTQYRLSRRVQLDLRDVRHAEHTSTRGVLGVLEGTGGSVTFVAVRLLVSGLLLYAGIPLACFLTPTQVRPDHFCNLDSNFMRLDHLQRPELNKGTVDFIVSDEYWAIEPPPKLDPSYAPVGPLRKRQHRPPQPMNYVFAFDVSADAVKSGFLRSSCDALRTILYQQTEEGAVCKLPAGSEIAIISYDCVINVFKLVGDPAFTIPVTSITPASQSGSGIADVLVVPDIEDVFMPLGPDVFVNPVEAR